MLANVYSRASVCFLTAAIVFSAIAAGSPSVLAQSLAATMTALFAVTFALGQMQARSGAQFRPIPVRVRNRRIDG